MSRLKGCDFSSALYLGFRHPSDSLPSWTALTTGAPSALKPTPGSRSVEHLLAELLGCEKAVLGPSTLHLLWDLFGQFPGGRDAILLDARAYPIVRWGVERAAARGIPVRVFRHQDPDHLLRTMSAAALRARRPVVVTDGLCAECGRVAPLRDYLELIRPRGGWLVVDDTQALGVLGRRAGSGYPYGRGGGGSLSWCQASGGDVIAVVSLAKAFGVPVAALAASARLVNELVRRSETRVCCSPPSVADVLAARRALVKNRTEGDRLRRRLALRVNQLRDCLFESGFETRGDLFPVQGVVGLSASRTLSLYSRLQEAGIRAILRTLSGGATPQLALIVTAAHQPREIAYLGSVLSGGSGEAVFARRARRGDGDHAREVRSGGRSGALVRCVERDDCRRRGA